VVGTDEEDRRIAVRTVTDADDVALPRRPRRRR